MELGLDTAAFSTGSRKASKDADVLGARMEKLGNTVGTAIKGFVALYAINELKNLARAGLQNAAALGEVSTQLGISTSALQEYRYAATQTGLSQEELEKGLTQLTRRIGEAASGNKAQALAFSELGIAVKDAQGNVLNAADALPKLADALEKVQNPAQRSAIAAEFFGSKLGGKFQTLLAGGSRAVNQLRDDAHKLGLVLSEDQIQNADRTADKLSALYNVLGTSVAGVMANNSQAIYDLANALATLTSQSLKYISEYPRLSAALAGAAIGAKYGKIPGAIIGAGAGLVGGELLAGQQADSNPDLRFRIKKQDEALKNLRQIQRNARQNGPLSSAARGGVKEPGTLRFAAAEVTRQTKLLKTATALAKAPTGAPKVDAAVAAIGGGGGSGKGKGGGGGPSGPSPAEIQARFEQQLQALRDRLAAAQSSLAKNAEDRAEFELRQVEGDRLSAIKDYENDKNLDATKKERLIGLVETIAIEERRRIEEDKVRQLDEEQGQIAQQGFDAARDRLQTQLQLADTDDERQRIALELLELDRQDKRQALERIANSGVRSDAERALAQQALTQLDASAALTRSGVLRSSETQTQGYLRGLTKSPAEMAEAIGQIKIDGLDALNEGLVQAITGVKSLGSVFKDIAAQIIADLLKIAIRQTIIKGLASVLNLGGSVGGGTSSAGGGGGIRIPGFASGTLSAPRGLALVGERGPELVHFRGGERVFPNGTGPGGGRATQVQVIPSAYFDVVVDGRVVSAAPSIIDGGARVAASRGARAQSRRLA